MDLKVQHQAIKRRLVVTVMAFVFWLAPATRAEQVGLIKISGAIGPATASYIQRAINEAVSQRYICLIIQLDTPGGLLDSTKEIVQSLYSSPLPTVVYVAPAGATAASAGCFITLAADVAAMAPGTSIGAAHPVAMGGGGTGQEPDEVMKKKLENFATTFIESIAARRHRNVEWAKTAVRESAAVTAEKALELKVIDILAKDIPDSAPATGRPRGQRQVAAHRLRRDPRSAHAHAGEGLSDALASGGDVHPHAHCHLRDHRRAEQPRRDPAGGRRGHRAGPGALHGVRPAGQHRRARPDRARGGAVRGGRLCADTRGADGRRDHLLLPRLADVVRHGGAAFRLSLALIIPATLVTAAFFAFVLGAGLRAQFLPIKAGKESMVGKTATALTPITAQSGRVFVEGAYWNAVSEAPVEEGKPVEIVGVQGLTLEVKPKT